MNRLAHLSLSLSIGLLASCSLIVEPFVEAEVPLKVSVTNAPDADIWIDGEQVGQGEVVAMVRRDTGHHVVARLGDRQTQTTVHREISTLGILDILGTSAWYLPIFGTIGCSFWTLEVDGVTLSIPARGQKTVKATEPACR